MTKSEVIKKLESMLGSWEPEHDVPYQNVLNKILNGDIIDFTSSNIDMEIKNEKQRLGWRV